MSTPTYNALKRFTINAGEDIFPVTPNDGVDLPGGYCRQLRCITAGTVSVITNAGQTRSFTFYNPGDTIDLICTRVRATGTTATLEAII